MSYVRHEFVSRSQTRFFTFKVMNSKTQELLNLLLWSADMLMRPTFRNLTDSYESWAYHNGLEKQLARLEQRRLIQRDAGSPMDRVYRLSAQGRLQALGGRDPQERWGRSWDGQWRMVIFDVPAKRNSHRERIRRYLRGKCFGCLQYSVWITPDPLEEERHILVGGKIEVESLLLLEARPCAGESDSEIVAGAWDFERINSRYARHLKILDERPAGALRNDLSAKMLLRWAAEERGAWLNAVSNDPLLPERILPLDYLGKSAWQRRTEMFQEAGRQMQTFTRNKHK